MSRYQTAVVMTEVPLLRRTDGRHLASLPTIAHADFARYLAVADRVIVVGRLSDQVPADDDPRAPIDGEGVSVVPLPGYRGFKQLAKAAPRVLATLLGQMGPDTLVVGRMPETISLLGWLAAGWKGADYLSFLVADPVSVLPLTGKGNAAKVGLIRRALASSIGVVYVTQSWLQQTYPARDGQPTLARSNVHLDEASFAPAKDGDLHQPPQLMHIGIMGAMPIKGQDMLIDVVAALKERGSEVHLTLVGDGPAREGYEAQAARLGVADRITFHGATPNAAANRDLLDASDVFVFASRTEGLPRAVIEAQARGLPVVTTNAGGVAELVQPDFVVDIDDQASFTDALVRLLTDDDLRRRTARENLAMARTIQESTAPERFATFLQRATAHRERARGE